MEMKTHGKFFLLRGGIADAVFQRCGGHFPHGDEVFDPCVPDQFFQIFVDMRAVAVESPPVSLKIIEHLFRLGHQIDHIEPERPNALFLPEPENLL